MNKLHRFGLVLILSTAITGCASYDIKPGQVLCPILGATLGAGIAGGGLGSSDGGALAGGAVVGAALGHFFCMDRPAKR